MNKEKENIFDNYLKKYISDDLSSKYEKNLSSIDNFNLENISNFLKSYPDYIDRFEKRTGSTLLFLSVLYGVNDVTEFLLSLKANCDIPSANGQTPLFLSVENSNYKIINLLLEAGANPNIGNNVNLLFKIHFKL